MHPVRSSLITGHSCHTPVIVLVERGVREWSSDPLALSTKPYDQCGRINRPDSMPSPGPMAPPALRQYFTDCNTCTV
jgi:hypothetical protein